MTLPRDKTTQTSLTKALRALAKVHNPPRPVKSPEIIESAQKAAYHTGILPCYSICLLFFFLNKPARVLYWSIKKNLKSYQRWFWWPLWSYTLCTCWTKGDTYFRLFGKNCSEDALNMLWSKHFWPPNSPDLNALNFFMWGVGEWTLTSFDTLPLRHCALPSCQRLVIYPATFCSESATGSSPGL